MTAAGSSEPVASLMAALAETARLLEQGDSEGATAAMAAVNDRCGGLALGGLTADEIADARQLLDRCRVAEDRLRRHVAEELAKSGAGTSRRAQAAYER
jgi:hypothetical protein